ncbi:MAG: transposase [Deltaproteobacteria bacterium]|nr:MAG: transposase [Deltaproteobacteria bacterium]
MPRQARLDAPGVLQHVMARGIERRKIFMDDQDRASFLERLALILEDTQTQCYAWALIPNHFHIFLRTGPTPLSTVMRRLMTGYAVTFNIRHRRSGHLFQNRYKSIICEEDPYLLELIRYIHLNPLRAKLVQDLKELDKYPWSGHSAILGRRKNPLIPDQTQKPEPMTKNQDKSLSETTIKDVLLHFGDAKKLARRRYHEFVEKGIAQGRRSEFQGGGLVRSAGGNKDGLVGRKKEEREKGDARILGSGDFVNEALSQAKVKFEKKYPPKRPIAELLEVVAFHLDLNARSIISASRKKEISEARALICHFAINDLSYSASEVARFLAISRVNAGRCADRGKKVLDKYQDLKNIVQ